MNRKEFLEKYDKDSSKSIMEHNKVKIPYYVTLSRIKLCIYPQVFDPTWRFSTRSLIKNIKINKEDSVLDMGTGSGILSIFSMKKGASKVVSVDINDNALKCAKFNFKTNRVMDKIELRKSNLFSKVGKQKFDVIIFNSPQRTIKPKNIFERSFFDYKMGTINRFIINAKKFLKSGGRIYISYGKAGEMEKLEKLMKLEGYKVKVIDVIKYGIRLYVVYELTLNV